MKCGQVLPLLRDYVDGELQEHERREIEAHLAGCGACSRRAAAERELKALIRGHLRPEPAPRLLTQAVLSRVEAGAAVRGGWSRFARTRRFGVVAGLATVILGAGFWVAMAGDPSRLAVAVVDDHIRFLGDLDAAEFKTRAPREAERWFSSRMDLDVTLPRFDGDTLRLSGGRLCYIMDRRVALLFYEREGRRASLFVMGGAGLRSERLRAKGPPLPGGGRDNHKGYQVLVWRSKGLLYALVADQENDRIAEEVREAIRL